MFKKILVPTDGSPLSEKAALAAVKFASELNATIFAISVADPYTAIPPIVGGIPLDPNFYDEDTRRLFEAQPEQLAKKNVAFIQDAAQKAQVECETMTCISTMPYEEIVKAVISCKCELVFMAAHGRSGFNRLILGSEAQKVIAYSTVPVLIHR